LSQAQVGAPHFTRAYVSALELGKIRPAMRSIEFLATKLGKPVAYFVEDEEQQKRRQQQELAIARAGQLISQGSPKEAITELQALDVEGLPALDRLAVKRSLGRAYVEAGQPAAAASTLTECLRAYQANNDEESVARTRAQLGGALIAMMNYAEAEEHLQEALRSTARGVVRDPLFRVHALHNLGLTYYCRANYNAALEHFDRAAREGSDIADQKWLASLHAAMGMSRRQIGDNEGAITCFLKSEALFEALHNQDWVSEIRFQTARTLRALGNKSRASAVLQEALSAAQASGNDSLAIRIEVFMGVTAAQDGDNANALRRLEQLDQRADAVEDPRARFAVRFGLAKVLAIMEPARAALLLKNLAAQLEKTGATEELGDVLDELSKALGRQGQADEALAYAQRAYALSQKAKGGR
jgi:tetratricopeptide (TPR) repeat protein